ncbi:MAG: hypothetical protein E7434_01565 [Ruminococcaceae bacterium]|nr:hypothetical protein [Oscillospiraceae bacterium]
MEWSVIAALLGGSFGAALVALVQFLINRNDRKKDKTDAVIAKVEQMQKEFEEERANNARIRILRFSDEVRHGVRHSKESFDQVNLDIDAYRRYCDCHPEYKNNRAVMAIANIERVYSQCLREQDFLE